MDASLTYGMENAGIRKFETNAGKRPVHFILTLSKFFSIHMNFYYTVLKMYLSGLLTSCCGCKLVLLASSICMDIKVY